ncbi:hypothetical protein NMY22_g8809 [Coprinellus aureogranulatus]|nr:hypothetical protein NMY22_g8809 [Coprinellus aureogranulatus]
MASSSEDSPSQGNPGGVDSNSPSSPLAQLPFLHGLALQSRAFSEPVLDCLWKHLGSLVPLIRLIPSAIVVEVANQKTLYLSGATRELNEGFHKYAKRVRTLHISILNENTHQIDPSVYVFLTQLLAGAPLLPGLKVLRLESNNNSFSWHTLPILFPCGSLTDIVFGEAVANNTLTHQVTLPLLVHRASALRSLTINYQGTSELLYPLIFKDSIFRLQHLQSLDCTIRNGINVPAPQSAGLPSSFLKQLGRNLQQLQTLTLDLELPLIAAHKKEKKKGRSKGGIWESRGSSTAAEVDEVDPSMFPNIRHLDLTHRSDTHPMRYRDVWTLTHNVSSLTLTLRPYWISSISSIVEKLHECPKLRHLTLKEDQSVSLLANDVVLFLAHLNLEQLHLNIIQVRQRRVGYDGTTVTESAGDCLKRILDGGKRSCKKLRNP